MENLTRETTSLNTITTGQSLPWWVYILVIDIFLVVMSVARVYYPESESLQFFGRPFNLATEMNLAVWWSGITLAVVGIVSYELFCTGRGSAKYGWLSLSILMLGLSLDEVGSLHEKLNGWSELLPFATICAVLFFHSLFCLFKDKEKRNSAALIVIAFLLYGSVVLQEYFEHITQWEPWMLGIRLGIEEGTELFATLLLLIAIVPHRKLNTNSLRVVLPNPSNMIMTAQLLLMGLIAHLIIFIKYPELASLTKSGNPLVWLPMIAFFMIACASYWNIITSNKMKIQWAVIGIAALFCSILTMWNLLYFIPPVKQAIPAKLVPLIIYIGISAIMLYCYYKLGNKCLQNISYASAPILVLTASLIYYYINRDFDIAKWSVVSIFFSYLVYIAIDSSRKSIFAKT